MTPQQMDANGYIMVDICKNGRHDSARYANFSPIAVLFASSDRGQAH